jgi:hypothetical protein
MKKIQIKIKIRKLHNSFVRDKWGNLKDIYWNQMIKEEIEKLEKLIENEKT